MRKISSLFLVALLTFSFGFGVASAGNPHDGTPTSTTGGAKGRGAITVKIRENGTNERVGDWSCTGIFVSNKNHSRVNLECKIETVGTLAGTYSSATHDVPTWLNGESGGYAAEAAAITGLSVDDVTSWSLEVKPNGKGGGHVSGVAFLD
jgi:hypothetical protein